MIRWYDYIVAILLADVILALIVTGIISTVWWHPLVYGFFAGIVFQLWNTVYCEYRVKKENQK